MAEDFIEEFKGKKVFYLLPSHDKKWVVEVYNIYDQLMGRIVCGNKAELILALEDNIENDTEDGKMDVQFEEN